MVRQGRDADRIAIEMENHLGRRRVDSHNFYRFTFHVEPEDHAGLTKSPSLLNLASKLEKSGGSLILRTAII